MTHSYIVTGITCEGCVEKVKSKLLAHPDITAADVQVEGKKASITMQRHLSIEELQDAIGRDTKYKITADKADHGHETMSTVSSSWFATYKPILLVFAFITAVSAIAATSHATLNSLAFMNNFMAGFFLVFSFFKFLNLKGFATTYAMYDVLARKVPVYGYIYPFIELALGLGYLMQVNPLSINVATIIVMGFSSIGVVQSVLDKKKIRCACLGDVFNLPMSTVTIIEDLLMVVMAAWVLLI